MRDWLATQNHWLQVERVPAYALELNPVEYLWTKLKGRGVGQLRRRRRGGGR
jgi:transposase